jgi:hypothetical protein
MANERQRRPKKKKSDNLPRLALATLVVTQRSALPWFSPSQPHTHHTPLTHAPHTQPTQWETERGSPRTSSVIPSPCQRRAWTASSSPGACRPVPLRVGGVVPLSPFSMRREGKVPGLMSTHRMYLQRKHPPPPPGLRGRTSAARSRPGLLPRLRQRLLLLLLLLPLPLRLRWLHPPSSSA